MKVQPFIIGFLVGFVLCEVFHRVATITLQAA